MRDFVDGAGAAVDGDEEGGAVAVESRDGGRVEAVAFAEAIGDIGDDAGAQRAQRLGHEGDGGDAVDVEVAEDGDRLAGRRGAGEAGDGFVDIGQREGVALVVAVEECLRLGSGGDAAAFEEALH